jgi:hypothetical protein
VAGLLLKLTIGGAIAAAPLVAYHVYHGSVAIWLDDTVFAAGSLTRLEFFESYRYSTEFRNGIGKIVHPSSPAHFFVGLFWVVALALPAVLGVLVARSFRKSCGPGAPDGGTDRRPFHSPLPLLALFYFGVALHLQKWMYLFFALPLTVLGLLAMAPVLRPAYRRPLLGAVWVVSLIGYVHLAGPFRGLTSERSSQLVANHGIPRCSLLLEPFQVETYQQFLGLIDRDVPADGSILALPVIPELYYLSGRRNPTRFYLPAIGVRSDDDVRALTDTFSRSPPRLVFYMPNTSYQTPECRRLRDWFVQRCDLIGSHRGTQVYRYRGEPGEGTIAHDPATVGRGGAGRSDGSTGAE